MEDMHYMRAGAGQPEDERPLREREQRRRDELNKQADIIEYVLETHKLHAAVLGGMANHRMARFQLLPAPGIRINQVAALREELALHLGVAECRISRNGAQIHLEIPLADPDPVSLMPLLHALLRSAAVQTSKPGRYNGDDAGMQMGIPPETAILGIDDRESTPLMLKLTSPDVAHLLVSGNTGSGKTVLGRTIVLSLAFTNDPADLRLILIDPKRRGYMPFSGLPHLAHPVVSTAEQVLPVLQAAVDEMLRRDAQSIPANSPADAQQPPAKKATRRRKSVTSSEADETGQAPKAAKLELGIANPKIVIVIDELADLILNSGDAGREIARLLTRLTLRGREAGIHVIACTQKPSAELMGGLTKSNFPTRLVGRVSSPEDARVAAGIGGTGAERLLGQGDFLLVWRGEVRRFQAAQVTASEIQRESRQLREQYDQALIQNRRQEKERQQRAQQFQRSHFEQNEQIDYAQNYSGQVEYSEYTDLEKEYEQKAMHEQAPRYRAAPQSQARVLPPSKPGQYRHPIADARVRPDAPPQKQKQTSQPPPVMPQPQASEPEEEFVEEQRPRSKKEMLWRFLRG